MASYFDLKKQISAPSAGSSTGYFDLKKRVSPVIERNRDLEEQRAKEQRRIEAESRASSYMKEAQRIGSTKSIIKDAGSSILKGGLNIAKTLATETARLPVTTPLKVMQTAQEGFTGRRQTYQPESKVGKFLLGDEERQSYQQDQKGIQKFAQERGAGFKTSATLGALGAGAEVFLDLALPGFGKTIIKKILPKTFKKIAERKAVSALDKSVAKETQETVEELSALFEKQPTKEEIKTIYNAVENGATKKEMLGNAKGTKSKTIETKVAPEEVVSLIDDSSKGVTKKSSKIESQISKAKKEGKSFDEFVGNDKVYHGTNAEFDTFKNISETNSGWLSKGHYFAKDLGEAKDFGKNIKDGYLKLENPFKIKGDIINKDGTITFVKNAKEQIFEEFPEARKIKWGDVSEFLQNKGYDGIDNGSNIVAFNPNKSLKTKSQLKQLWDKQGETIKTKAQSRPNAPQLKKSSVKKEVAPKKPHKPNPKESITAKKMNERLNGVDELSTKYDVVNLKKEVAEASDLIIKNKTKAVEKVFSDTGSNTQKVAIAAELFEKAALEGNIKTQSLLFDRIKKLSTETAQALNMFKALTVTNPHFKYMKEVVDLRLGEIKITGDDITKAISKKTEPIVASLKKATKSKIKIANAQKMLDKLIC